MISKNLLRLRFLWKPLYQHNKYTFTSFPSKKDKQLIAPKKFTDFINDDLAFTFDTSEINGGIQQICEHIKKNPDIDLKPMNMAFVMYNSAVKDLYEPMVFEEIERKVYKFKGAFKPRWAFGSLYGIYKTNAGTVKGIEFFEQELIANIEHISRQEAVELFDAISHNTQLRDSHKKNFIITHLKPIILNNWKRGIEYQNRLVVLLFNASIRMGVFDKEICDLVLETMKKKKKLGGSKLYIEIYETITELQKSGKFYRDLTEDIAVFKGHLAGKPDVEWRYNIEEQRFYNYYEMKAVRDDYKYPNQMLKSYIEELTEEEKQKKRELEELRAQVESQQARDNALNEIVRERYYQLLRGDDELGMEEFMGEDDEFLEDLKNIEITEFEEGDEEVIDGSKSPASQQKDKAKLNAEKKIRKAMSKGQ